MTQFLSRFWWVATLMILGAFYGMLPDINGNAASEAADALACAILGGLLGAIIEVYFSARHRMDRPTSADLTNDSNLSRKD